MAPKDAAASLLPLAASFPCPRVHAQLQDAACSYMGRSRSLENVTQVSGPALSCSVCACLRASWLVLELRLPWLCTVLAHQGPNNGFIRAELLYALPLLHHYPPKPGWQWQRAFPRPQASYPPSPQWPNHEVGLVPARLWAWSPLMGWLGPWDPGWGTLLGPSALPGAGSGRSCSLRWGCSRGPTCASGLLQEGRGELQNLG